MRRLDTVYETIAVSREVFNFPAINPNSTSAFDLAATSVVLGTHIISWTPESDARAFDDLLIQWMVVDTDVVRVILQNPTGGMITPGIIPIIFVLGKVKSAVVATVNIANLPPP